MFDRYIVLVFFITFILPTSANEYDASFQDFPIGCSLMPHPALSQNFIDEATELIANLSALALLAQNKPVSQALVSAIARIFARTIKFIKTHCGYSYGLFPKLSQIVRTHKPRNAMDEIDLIIKQTQPSTGDKEAQFVLHAFANIMHNFANIVGSPRNPDIVADNITHIFSGLVSIAKQAITKGQEPLFLIHLEPQLAHELITKACEINDEEIA